MDRLRKEIYQYIKDNTVIEDIEMGFFGDIARELQYEFDITMEEAEQFVDDFSVDMNYSDSFHQEEDW